MRIAFDGTTLRPGRSGVGYYAEHLLHHVALQSPNDEVVVFSNEPIETVAPLPANVRTCTRFGFKPRLAWLQLAAPRVLEALRPDIVHYTNGITALLADVPSVVTIHDMSLTLYPRYHPARRVLLKRPFVGLAAQRVAAVLTISHTARRDIVRLYNLPPARVHVVYGAAAPAFRRITDGEALAAIRRRYALPDRFLLYVGNIEPRKNLQRLVEAFADARRTGELPHQLVCVGGYGWKASDLHRHIDRLGISRAVRFVGYVPFEDLAGIYSLAEIFLFPSLYEGFGLPVIEAMACGVPVVTARTSALGEIANGAAESVDPLETGELAEAIVRLARDRGRREDLSQRGLARSAVFSWQRAAIETWQIYRRVAGLADAAADVTNTMPVAAGAGEMEELACSRASLLGQERR